LESVIITVAPLELEYHVPINGLNGLPSLLVVLSSQAAIENPITATKAIIPNNLIMTYELLAFASSANNELEILRNDIIREVKTLNESLAKNITDELIKAIKNS